MVERIVSGLFDDESPGGVSPPGAPKTVREPLDSYGSRCSAAAMAYWPMGEELWLDPPKSG